jgi:hypothetical protein
MCIKIHIKEVWGKICDNQWKLKIYKVNTLNSFIDNHIYISNVSKLFSHQDVFLSSYNYLTGFLVCELFNHLWSI